MFATTTADISWPMNSAESLPVAAAYICDMGTAPRPSPPAMIGAATKRMPCTNPKPVAAPSRPTSRNVAARQPTSGTANRGPASQQQRPRHPQDAAGDDRDDEEVEEAAVLDEAGHDVGRRLREQAGEQQDRRHERAEDRGGQPEVAQHRHAQADGSSAGRRGAS